MESGINQVIVAVDDRLVRSIALGAKTLEMDPTYDIYRNTKIKATILSVPERISSTVLYEKFVGFPYPTRVGPTGRRHPINFVPQMAIAFKVIDIKKGDTIYFHYLSLSASNYLGRSKDGLELYKIGYEQLFCRVRGGKITMLNGFVAVSSFWDESYEDVYFPEMSVTGELTGKKRKLRIKQSKGGIIYDINEKPLYRSGVVEHRGLAPDEKFYAVAGGHRIIYSDFSEFKNVIEGTEYYMMKLWNIVAVYKNRSIEPMIDYVLIDVTPAKKSFLIIPQKYKKDPDEGRILAIGSEVKNLVVGDDVKFNLHNKMFIDIDGLKGTFMRSSEVFAKKKRTNVAQ